MFTNPRTTISGAVTVLAWILARFGLDVPIEVADAIIVIGVFVVGFFARDRKPAETKPDTVVSK